MPREQNILVVLPSWIGDTIMSQSLLFELKKIYPDCNIDVIARSYIKELIELIPEINKKYYLDIDHGKFGLRDRLNLASTLKLNNYTRAYILSNSLKSSIVPWLVKIPSRIGYSTELRGIFLTESYKYKKHERTMVERYLYLIDKKYTVDIKPRLNITQQHKDKASKKFEINLSKKIIMLCPDAEYGSAKKWPLEHWVTLANLFSEKDFNVYFLGKDESINNYLENNYHNHNIKSLIGKTSLLEVVYLLSLANLAISNDSGLMHIAGAVNSKIIAIYGSSSPFYTPPLISGNDGEVVYKGLSCSPCFKRECPLSHLNCLRSISSEEILNISLNYL